MGKCKECMHYKVCAKEGRLTQIDEHTWDYFNELDNVEKFCDNYISTADVVPKSEVEKIFKDLLNIIRNYSYDAMRCGNNYGITQAEYIGIDILQLKKKYTEADDV